MNATEIHQAIEAGDGERVRGLLTEHPEVGGARVGSGGPAVMTAVSPRRPELLEPLLASAPPLDVFEAATLGREDRLAALLDADPSCTHAWSSDGGTALHFAAFFKQPGCARLLLERGADASVPARGFGHAAPLHSAAASRSHEVVQMLLNRGAPVDGTQEGGWTALMSAAHSGDRELAELLLAHGADPRCKANDGSDPGDKAEQAGFRDLAARLRGAPQTSGR